MCAPSQLAHRPGAHPSPALARPDRATMRPCVALRVSRQPRGVSEGCACDQLMRMHGGRQNECRPSARRNCASVSVGKGSECPPAAASGGPGAHTCKGNLSVGHALVHRGERLHEWALLPSRLTGNSQLVDGRRGMHAAQLAARLHQVGLQVSCMLPRLFRLEHRRLRLRGQSHFRSLADV